MLRSLPSRSLQTGFALPLKLLLETGKGGWRKEEPSILIGAEYGPHGAEAIGPEL